MENHSERAHALLSASGAEKWLNCTPSARLEESYGVRKTSPYAEEGTFAHELAQLYLTKDLTGTLTDDEFEEKFEELTDQIAAYDKMPIDMSEMMVEVTKYVDFCEDILAEVRKETKDALFKIEEKFELTEYVPEGFGTNDFIVIGDKIMYVVDLKYGAGLAVSAVENKQLMIYALGAISRYGIAYEIEKVVLIIVQPRLDNISQFETTLEHLLDFGNNFLKEKAAVAFKGEGELNAGSWCKFCAVKHSCKKLAEANIPLVQKSTTSPHLLTDEQIAEFVLKAETFKSWAKGLIEYATEKAIKDKKVWPGLKLIQSSSRRKWAEEQKVVSTIKKHFPLLDDNDIFKKSLKPFTEIEKLVGKQAFKSKLDSVLIKPDGTLKLVPVDDKRPAVGLQQALDDFKD